MSCDNMKIYESTINDNLDTEPFTDYEGEQLLEASAKYHFKKISECPHKYEDIDVKSGTLDVRTYCDLKKGKLCPNIDCICWYAKR